MGDYTQYSADVKICCQPVIIDVLTGVFLQKLLIIEENLEMIAIDCLVITIVMVDWEKEGFKPFVFARQSLILTVCFNYVDVNFSAVKV